jgi:hypothetical protein
MRERATVIPLTVSLRREDILHFLGYRGMGTPGPRVEEMLPPVILEARTLVAARGIYQVSNDYVAASIGLEPPHGATLALGLVTIGFELERQVSRLLSKGEATRALLLDAAGSAAAEEAADELERRIRAEAGAVSGGVGDGLRRFSPGYGSWPLTAQRALFELLPSEAIQVRLLASCLMSPRKSVSFGLWLAPGADSETPEACRASRCADCDQTSCPYREPEEP